jgi:hypothetical protein
MESIEVYCHIKAEKAENVVDCGLKLSEMADREILLNGMPKRCFQTYLSPEDDKNCFGKIEFRCLKIQVRKSVCRMADAFLYEMGNVNENTMELYEKSIIPLDNYVFGMYRMPVCLITTTMLPGEITLLNKNLDSPVLFRKSEELYVNNLIEDFRNENENIYDNLLYSYFVLLEQRGQAIKLESEDTKMAVFTLNGRNETYRIRNLI